MVDRNQKFNVQTNKYKILNRDALDTFLSHAITGLNKNIAVWVSNERFSIDIEMDQDIRRKFNK
jgi:hypothetical protein